MLYTDIETNPSRMTFPSHYIAPMTTYSSCLCCYLLLWFSSFALTGSTETLNTDQVLIGQDFICHHVNSGLDDSCPGPVTYSMLQQQVSRQVSEVSRALPLSPLGQMHLGQGFSRCTIHSKHWSEIHRIPDTRAQYWALQQQHSLRRTETTQDFKDGLLIAPLTTTGLLCTVTQSILHQTSH